ncbi:uncharacterized protein EDB91DRAFT_1051514, partial [Suillus paluster]|uniref:uncharacterized protein n=1 Tax=Suillus paluster TaxID=48578 RepID=UPI001B87A8F2
ESPAPSGVDMIWNRIMADLKELYFCRLSKENFERTWRPDAVFEASFMPFYDSLILIGSLQQMRVLCTVSFSDASL